MAPIASSPAPLFLSRVLARSVRLGIQTGIIAAAATAGAIVGLGARHGVALVPFTIAGRAVVGGAPATAACLAGLALHLAWMIVWGACFTLVAATLRGGRLLLGALLFVAALWALATFVLPAVNPVFRVAALSTPQTALAYLLLALSLVVGMRIAQPAFEG